MSLVSRNKTNGANVQVTPTIINENNGNGTFDSEPVTPDMVLHMPAITDSKWNDERIYIFISFFFV